MTYNVLMGTLNRTHSLTHSLAKHLLCFCCTVVPHSNLYIVISPVCAMVDYLTIEWLNEFLLDLAKRAVSLMLQDFYYSISCWRRIIVVRTLVLASELSLSCARLLAGWVTTLWLSRLLSYIHT